MVAAWPIDRIGTASARPWGTGAGPEGQSSWKKSLPNEPKYDHHSSLPCRRGERISCRRDVRIRRIDRPFARGLGGVRRAIGTPTHGDRTCRASR